MTLLLAGILPAEATPAGTPLESLSLDQLEQRLEEIDAELAQLAHYSLRSGIGSIGYRSLRHKNADGAEWIEVEFDREYPIDEIMLVPAIWRDTEKGFQADGFPEEFRILAGTTSNRTGAVVAEYGVADGTLPRIAPLVVPIHGTSASWVRVEATHLTPRAFDGSHIFQLSEILVFSGPENVALRQPVKTSSNAPDSAGAWDERFLVDGFMPYLMDSAQGNQSLAYVSQIGDKPALTIDLGTSRPISRIHLHAVDQGDTVPQAYAGDLGIPHHLRIDGANRADFSDAETLLDYRQNSINDTGPIMMWNIPETICRYVRVSEVETDLSPDINTSKFRIGFAEIELFSNGRNVALGKSASGGTSPSPNRTLSALTDGNNLYGKILPVRDWLDELARRHGLETERPQVEAELTRRFAHQKTNLNRMSWLAALLAAGIGFTFLIDRNLRMRQLTRIKERFAADLHDELGANLHTIGLLGDLAREAVDSREELIELLDRSRVFTERSGAAARHCTNMLEAKGLCEDLVDEMKRSSARLLADLDHGISFEGEEILQRLKPRNRIDLFFFYKECLTNIIRHSGATQVTTKLSADSDGIQLTITDNGHGLNGEVPSSLKRRARLLGAQVSTEPSESGGTCIMLKFRPRRGLSFSQRSISPKSKIPSDHSTPDAGDTFAL
jgi:signal transduction histidine kinase